MYTLKGYDIKKNMVIYNDSVYNIESVEQAVSNKALTLVYFIRKAHRSSVFIEYVSKLKLLVVVN